MSCHKALEEIAQNIIAEHRAPLKLSTRQKELNREDAAREAFAALHYSLG